MSDKPVRISGPDHPITIEANPSMVSVTLDGQVIAQTSNALTLREANYPPVQYIPLADINADILSPSSKTTYCPYKGTASYFSINTPTQNLPDVIWSYREPYDAVAAIKDYCAFYPDRVSIKQE
ncbi:DUF427 domain-containing protein [Thalassospira marina]|uniref:DUF427 domain-containing protein n=1 Tax=Thalassospira marina TaxID=2048283 RepID=A0ABM6QGW5_9PROT|nr:DUF427 domain-containing protein [Thalassospira marina]AUG55797.1 hypothetical protein CSC3H3_23450 [Thalassospira marina]